MHKEWTHIRIQKSTREKIRILLTTESVDKLINGLLDKELETMREDMGYAPFGDIDK